MLFPQEIMRHIFEYDSTFREIFSKEVLPCIWKMTWTRWSKTLKCPFERIAASHFLDHFQVQPLDKELAKYDTTWNNSEFFKYISARYFVTDVCMRKNRINIHSKNAYCLSVTFLGDKGRKYTHTQYNIFRNTKHCLISSDRMAEITKVLDTSYTCIRL